ncbi:MAG: hypothetical protein Tsb0020_19200 [Haliangiales bacterium]
MKQPDPVSELDLLLDDQAGPARRISAARKHELLQSALAALPTAAPVAPTTRARRRSAWLLAAAVVLSTGVASAGYYTWVRSSAEHAPRPLPSAPAPVTPSEPDVPVEPPVVSTAEQPEPVAVVPAPPPPPEPARAEPLDPTPTPPRAKPDSASKISAANLIERANKLRRARSWRRAEATYQRVRRAYPDTQSADVATIAAASIRLEHLGDARGAKRLYSAALRRAGKHALAEEARWGLARVHRRLRDRDGERRMLRALLEHHPDSLLLPSARQRLRELDQRKATP